MSEATEPAEVGIARIYMKSGNVIVLPRVEKISYESYASGSRKIDVTQGGPPGGERLMVPTLDLTQIEGITWENLA